MIDFERSYQNLLLTFEDQILTITFNRPNVLNALNAELLDEMEQVLDAVEQDARIRAVIVTGAGDRSFVAGADISQMQKMTVQEARYFSKKGMLAISKLERIPVPTIAAVNGFALGGGCELAMACDIRIASVKAKFGQPEVNLGVIPGFGGTQRLPRLVGMGIAKELLLTGDLIAADRALAIGLVNQVVEAEQLLPAARDMAKRITSKGAYALALVKQAVHEGLEMDLDRALQLETELFSVAFSTEDQKEGMAAYLEKRKPEFKGK